MRQKILIVDDDPAIRSLLEHIFDSSLGKSFQVASKPDGLEAMLWLEKGNIPDLIITDLSMPNVDGNLLIDLIKSSGFYRRIPLIVVSGSDECEEKQAALKEKVHTIIKKPFNPEVLLQHVNQLLYGKSNYNTAP
jgi:two-component system, chemotaxis family, chemotaxis protein CheY